MATLYFDAAVDNDWTTLGNWRTDNFTGTRVQAASLPTSSDNVVVDASVILTGLLTQAVANFTMNQGGNAYGSLSVTGTATFNGSANCGMIVNGNVVLNDSSATDVGAVFGGSVVFNNSSLASGDCIFNGSVSFNDTSHCGSGTFNSSVVFNGSSMLDWYMTGNPVFNDYSVCGYGVGEGSGVVNGNATFNDSASCDGGSISGTATFNDTAYSTMYGLVQGHATFNGSSQNGGVMAGNATFNGSSQNNNGYVYGSATFNDTSVNMGPVTGYATFNDTSVNVGLLDSNAEFNDSALNQNGNAPNGTATFSLSAAEANLRFGVQQMASAIAFKYDKGVNGSSILGVV